MAAPIVGRIIFRAGWVTAGFVLRKLAGTEEAEKFKQEIINAAKDLGSNIKKGGFVCSPYDKNFKGKS